MNLFDITLIDGFILLICLAIYFGSKHKNKVEMKRENLERAKHLEFAIQKLENRKTEIQSFPFGREGAKVTVCYGEQKLVFERNELPIPTATVAGIAVSVLEGQIKELNKEFESL